jgi:putative tryptophan/tyrosine transport system substrate-binding protein
MNRRAFVTGLATTLVVRFAAEAQPQGKQYRIGYLSQGSAPTTRNPIWEAFRQQLRELGYLEGQNMIIEYRYADGKLDRLRDLAADLVRLKVDVIVAGGTPAPLAAKNATRTIPIVMAAAGDPVGTGLVVNLARPEANVTGLSNLSEELTGKRMQLFKDVLPRVSHVAVLWNAGNPVSTIMFKQAEAAAQRLGLQVQSVEVRRPDDFDQALAAVSGRPSTLFVVDDPLVFSQRALVAGFAVQHRLPSSAYYKEFVEAGGLMSLGPSLTYQFRRAAIFVDKILKGAKPADLPVEQPTQFELVINLKTAKALGVTIPQSLLLRADQVIE